MIGTDWDLELAEALCALNALRARRGPDARDPAERDFEERFGTSHRLAVYGSLAPGQANHHVVADLRGSWQEAVVTGTLRDAGWGAEQGFPALRWRAGGPPVAAHLLVSDDLPAHWERIDAFEGSAYRRILVSVHAADGALLTVANLYADADDD